MKLFDKNRVAGVFRGFTQGGLEFHADLVLPYQQDLHSIPMHGQMILVQLENPDEAVLGRIASFSSEGRLSYGAGEEFNIRAAVEEREVPEDLREQYLRYRVNIRVLGAVRINSGDLVVVPSQRRLPHVGSRVAFPSGEVLRALAGHESDGAKLGHYALGEYVYAAGEEDAPGDSWVRVIEPAIHVTFPVDSLVSRRTFCFARAGFGKSNLTKLLFSKLYEEQPFVTKRAGRKVPVGSVIFDPDGEYFWPDDRGRPGLTDVPHLTDRLAVFTNRRGPSEYYQSFVAAGVKIDIRRLSASDVVGLALSPERQDQQNVRKLRSMHASEWRELVDLIHQHRNNTDLKDVVRLMHLDKDQQKAEAIAARSNMAQIVGQLHDPASRMMDRLMKVLEEGKLCVIDLSQMRGHQGMVIASLVLRRIFDHNQEQFTHQSPRTIPTIAVIEEAQSVLVENTTATEPFVSWVKEGRKYDLGAFLITQQPGSIPQEILSQGDNWFVFHLISSGDLITLKKANAHYSDDLLSSLLNEPIPGHAVFWSSVQARPFPLSVRVQSFEALFTMADPEYRAAAVDTWARLHANAPGRDAGDGDGDEESRELFVEEHADRYGTAPIEAERAPSSSDYLQAADEGAIEALRDNSRLRAKIESTDGASWKEIAWFLQSQLPEDFESRGEYAFRSLTRKALIELYGEEARGWHTFRNAAATPNKDGSAPVHVSIHKPTDG